MNMNINININGESISKALRTFFTSRKFKILFLILSVLVAGSVIAATVVKPHTYTDGDTIYAADINDNFDTLFGLVSNVEANTKVIPSHIIVMWSGTIANIPAGWALCNGTNDTPDLTDRFILGTVTDETDPKGGSNTVSISHTHDTGSLSAVSSGSEHSHAMNVSTSSDGAHNHYLPIGQSIGADYGMFWNYSEPSVNIGSWPTRMNNSIPFRGFNSSAVFWDGMQNPTVSGVCGNHSHSISSSTDSDGAHAHTISGTTASAGSSSFDIRPAYYKLAFIMKK